jgi:cholesterol transport system auxiliary component
MKVRLLIPMLFLLTGCSVFHKPSPSMAVYDFGIQSLTQNKLLQPNQQRKSLLIADATTPSWLDNTAIHYRLLHNNPLQLYSYANSKWVSPPAAILTQQIRDRIVANTHEHVIKNSSTAKTNYILHIELEEFIQIFESLQSSHVSITLRASLIERNSRSLFAQKNFNIKEKAPTADAAGAVSAFGFASNQLINELIEWLTMELPVY